MTTNILTNNTWSRWVAVKSAKVRGNNGEVIDVLPFRKQCWEIDQKGNRTEIDYVGEDKKKHTGWILNVALTDKPMDDYALLFYENKTGKRVPVSYRIRGDVDGYLSIDEIVNVIVVTGDWCLTNRGWTLFKYLTKRDGEFFEENAKDLFTSILLQAVKDYQIAINRLRTGKCRDREDFRRTFNVIEEITRFFNETEIRKSKFEKLNENLGVDKKWLKEKKRIYEAIIAKEEEAKHMKKKKR